MYTTQPRGINIKQNDRDVPDGFLQESINLQWRDDAYRPIPDRLYSGIPEELTLTIPSVIDVDCVFEKYILHKVEDEDVR